MNRVFEEDALDEGGGGRSAGRASGYAPSAARRVDPAPGSIRLPRLGRGRREPGVCPTFPFWRPVPGAPWGFPPDARNAALAELNTHPLPDGIRAYAFYGDWESADPTVPGTWEGVTGQLPEAGFSYGPGDGIVLAASALGLPINGGAGVPGLADHLVMKVDLGATPHLSLLRVATSRIADVLADRGAVGRSRIPGESARRAHVAQDPPKDSIGLSHASVGLVNVRVSSSPSTR